MSDMILLISDDFFCRLGLCFSSSLISFNLNVLSFDLTELLVVFYQILILIFYLFPQLANLSRHPVVLICQVINLIFGFEKLLAIKIAI
jgi:hypothetical protein